MRAKEFVSEDKKILRPGKWLVDSILNVLPMTLEIWFHGSRAIGKQKRNSDTDILVVVPKDIAGKDYIKVVDILNNLSKQYKGYDIQPAHPNENIHRIAQEEGKLLYKNEQDITEPLEEIEKIPTYEFLGNEIDIGYFSHLDYKKAKPLDGEIKIILTRNSGDDYAVILIPKYHRVIGSVSYYTHITQSGGKELEIKTAALDKDFRGQGIITKAYKFLMRHFKAPIRAGSSQTIKAQRLWANLYRDPEITVVGYIDITRSEYSELIAGVNEKKFLDKLKKTNIVKADKILQPSRHSIRFLVPVKTLSSGILSFNKKTRFGGKIYDNNDDDYFRYTTGLLAILKRNKLKEK